MPLFETDLNQDIIEPLENGTYGAEISSQEVRKDKNGSDFVVWHWTVIDAGPNYGYELTSNNNLQNNVKLPNGEINHNARKKANYYLKLFFDAVRAPYGANGFETEAAVHCKARLKVVQKTIEGGRKVNQVEEVMPFEA